MSEYKNGGDNNMLWEHCPLMAIPLKTLLQ